MVTFPHTYLHILVPTFTGNLNLNFKILSEQKEFTLTNLPKYSLSLSPQEVTFSLLNRFSKTNHKIVSQTSREGLRQVYDDMYKFLLVTNFGGR